MDDAVDSRVWAWPGYVVLGAGWVLSLIAPGVVYGARFVPLLVSLVVFGLPHGAVDHLVPGWVTGRALGGRRLCGFLGGYLLVVAIGLAGFLVDPVVAVVIFLTVTAVHWGTAERAFSPGQPRPTAFAAARGIVPILVPAVTQPAAFAAGIHLLLSAFLTRQPDLAPAGITRWTMAAGVVVILVAGAGRGRRAPGELAALVVFFATVTPVFAIGLYFISWHSLRHVVRLTALSPRARARRFAGRPWAAIGEILRAALPLSLVSLLGLAGLVLVLSAAPTDAGAVLAVALALIAALTTPHTMLVLWLDRVQAHGAGRPGTDLSPGAARCATL